MPGGPALSSHSWFFLSVRFPSAAILDTASRKPWRAPQCARFCSVSQEAGGMEGQCQGRHPCLGKECGSGSGYRLKKKKKINTRTHPPKKRNSVIGLRGREPTSRTSLFRCSSTLNKQLHSVPISAAEETCGLALMSVFSLSAGGCIYTTSATLRFLSPPIFLYRYNIADWGVGGLQCS